MKTTGALWNKYMHSWPEGQWFDDSDEHVGGVALDGNIPRDDDVVEFSVGSVFKSSQDRSGVSLVRHFSVWEKAQLNELFVCTVPKERVTEFLGLISSMGIKAKVG